MINFFFLALAFGISTVAGAMENDLESVPLSSINSEVGLARSEAADNCCSRWIGRTFARIGAWRQFFSQNRAQDRNADLRDAAMAPIARRAIRATVSCCKRFGMKTVLSAGGLVWSAAAGYAGYQTFAGEALNCKAMSFCDIYYGLTFAGLLGGAGSHWFVLGYVYCRERPLFQ